jgi:2'-5' RNA ligase
MKRTFIAVKLEAGEDLTDAISSLKAELRHEIIRWVEISNMHITLAFIGNTEEPMIKKVGKMLENDLAGTDKFEFDLTGFGVFRNISDPRIIFTGIVNPGKLIEAHEIVKKGLEELDIKLEERQFKPHLTIGRIKDLRDKSTLQRLILKYSGVVLQTVKVSEIIYYESVLLPAGQLYKSISTAGLLK